MKTTITVNSLKELITVAKFCGIEVKPSEIAVSFPYRFEVSNMFVENEEMTFEEFEYKYSHLNDN
jgi:hypothetical protein